MKNLFIITSVINAPDSPLSYTSVRSIYSSDKRYEQTLLTIQSIRDKVPDVSILIAECSKLSSVQEETLIKLCDYYVNLYDDDQDRKSIFGRSKSLGEGTLTIRAIEYIEENKIHFDNLFKISGRYLLNQYFDYKNNYDNDCNIICTEPCNDESIYTFLYKTLYVHTSQLKKFLYDHIPLMQQCIGYEQLMKKFFHPLGNTKYITRLGVSGNIAVDGYVIDR